MADPNLMPVLRFCVCSDLHIKEDGDVHVQRLQKWMQTAYAVAQQDEHYKQVDAFLFAGDLTDHGTPAQFSAFWNTVQRERKGNTQILSAIAKNHDNWENGRNAEKTGLRHYREITGLSTDTHLTIAGFHFIAISTCEKKGRYYNRKQKKWLKQALQAAAKDRPTAPIFVMQHEHVTDTVFGSSTFDGWGNRYFQKILSRFPQIVHFSGHSHYPLNDPRSIVQQDFTAVGTGALSYAEFTVGSARTVHPEQADTMAQGWIVQVDAQGRVRLDGYDILSGVRLCSYLLDVRGETKNFTLTAAQQKSRSSAPRFPDGADLAVETAGSDLLLTVPAAESTDGFPVFLYRAALKAPDGSTLAQAYTLHEYWFVHEKPFYTITLPRQPGKTTVFVQAENAYGMASTPITKEVSFDV